MAFERARDSPPTLGDLLPVRDVRERPRSGPHLVHRRVFEKHRPRSLWSGMASEVSS